MGAQQTKDRVIPAGSAVRQARKQPRNPKDSRLIGSNIFTEHSGNSDSYFFCLIFVSLLLLGRFLDPSPDTAR